MKTRFSQQSKSEKKPLSNEQDLFLKSFSLKIQLEKEGNGKKHTTLCSTTLCVGKKDKKENFSSKAINYDTLLETQ